jgi:hypothetical protein
MVSAYMWLRIGASAGDMDSAKNLEAIKKMLTAEQITEAERRASAWETEHKR